MHLSGDDGLRGPDPGIAFLAALGALVFQQLLSGMRTSFITASVKSAALSRKGKASER